MNSFLNGDVPTRVHCDLESLTTLAIMFGATIGKLRLMRDCGAIEEFWGEEVDDLINASEKIRDFVMEVLEINQGLENAIDQSVH